MKTQNHPSTSDANAADVDRERIEYECPHCGARYDNETLARIHITRSDDEAHGDRDGLVPGEAISIVDDDGSDLGTSEIDAEQQDVQELSVDDIPDDYKQQHQQIILVGAQKTGFRHPIVQYDSACHPRVLPPARGDDIRGSERRNGQ
jgi:hypothetical protein